jgi:hypothetical protein
MDSSYGTTLTNIELECTLFTYHVTSQTLYRRTIDDIIIEMLESPRTRSVCWQHLDAISDVQAFQYVGLW